LASAENEIGDFDRFVHAEAILSKSEVLRLDTGWMRTSVKPPTIKASMES
jgi:hypothetical protein